MEERRIRTIAKTISWRALATLATMLIVYVYTREMLLSIGVGAVEVGAKIALYYAHERLWARSRWGVSGAARRPDETDWGIEHAGEDIEACTPIGVGYAGD